MTNISRALAVSLSGAFLVTASGAFAQGNTTPPTTATRPTTPDQNSLPNANAPPASTTQTTGQHNPDPKVQEMNQKEKDKVDRQGK
ncbi:hypothetical protein ML401_25105 [Bradyrhizobium sp. 62B]|jgi:hypothetical protein|uniref:hypothetical protein n=1 Tax=Bradyrhizobium TaxID=374 RepID=UPI001886B72E|nr:MULTISPECIES: hypothetical protein [Bradyrhizobium]WIW44736.1 hypothetical protein ML401_25105 [Bradyrhizobium sp. 62B]MBR0704773.1 hypothetical protein [Bradyrhizobium diazoefficiens]MBR0768626.1 hypothetical protein [Bradyrhizobium diazoefficiens]MBR0931473.1 hypothetical protein [Bradyrhizobium diazoefficiens]MCS3763304.1 hypothetical protein [Bradyrhizobium centrosematis]